MLHNQERAKKLLTFLPFYHHSRRPDHRLCHHALDTLFLLHSHLSHENLEENANRHISQVFQKAADVINASNTSEETQLFLHTSWWTWIFWSRLTTLVAGIPASKVHVTTGPRKDKDSPELDAKKLREHTWNTTAQLKWHLRVRTNPITIFGFPTSTLEAPTSSISTSWTCRQNYNQNKGGEVSMTCTWETFIKDCHWLQNPSDRPFRWKKE